jgi:hypothetical protein
MDLLFYILGGGVAGGFGLALVERRRKRNFLAHDFNLDASAQSEADREKIRVSDSVRHHTHQ